MTNMTVIPGFFSKNAILIFYIQNLPWGRVDCARRVPRDVGGVLPIQAYK